MPANLNAMISTLLGFFAEALKALGMDDLAAKLTEIMGKIPAIED
ncbi:MAG: hypothetical protein UHM85_03870 [Acutalibacteraceae bacterium]|nr:hypothetical protein [Acutalibacteraceae bacterium]